MEQHLFKLTHVWLFVTDVERSIHFYRDTLGLRMNSSWPDGAMFDTGATTLAIHGKSQDGKHITAGGTVVVLQTDDIERSFGELKNRGVVFGGEIKTESYGRLADFTDPDGHGLELYQAPSA